MTASVTPSVTFTPTVTATASVTPSISVTPSVTFTPTVTATTTVTPTVTRTASVTPTISVTPSVTFTPTVTMTASVTPTISVTHQATVSATPPVTPPGTPPVTPTRTPSVTPPVTPTMTPTQTLPLVTISAQGSVNVFASSIAYKFYTSEGSTGLNQATIYGTFNSSNFNVPNLPAGGSNINVTFYVDRVAPDGIAADVGYVIWYLDGSQVSQANFNRDDQVQKFYTMSINKDSVVVVTALEG